MGSNPIPGAITINFVMTAFAIALAITLALRFIPEKGGGFPVKSRHAE
jgi:hypothetical protein